ncbi:MAG: UDP-glucose/GDP-mannose dehydrogenase family protein [Acidobacteriota bacterium]|nr:UDP-glucose/GDP-mannose dehydrogenase family protein [Acidobacteriota bacterium]MDH3784081.1 UDP-glucose/GDP-mannose dehydrogenase family protein [Acidobacteriota bacterium]
MNICVVGTGYVGLVTGACFAEFGNPVVCVDKDASKIDALNDGKIPIYEPGLDDLVHRNASAGRLKFTTNLNESIQDALVVFIAVGTPQDENGRANLSFVRDVARSVGENLNSYKVVVTKSTVPAGTGEMIRKIISETRSEEVEFSVASNPEFLREGSAIEDFMRPNRVVLGTDDEQAAAILQDLYRPLFLIETPIVVTNVVTAELIKYASNAFLATKICYINEMADLSESLGADVNVVAKAMGLDRRIGQKFLHAGPGYGGSCFPKDTRAIAGLASDFGHELRIVRAVIEVNERRADVMLEKIEKTLGGDAKGKTIGMLGLTFKPNTDDLRESPAVAIVDKLLARGAKVQAYDPVGMELLKAEGGRDGLTFCGDEYETATGADAVVLATEWNQFRSLDMRRLKELLAKPVMIDLRNIYDRKPMEDAGFTYVGVGR